MKKNFFIIYIITILIPVVVFGSERQTVTLSSCIDGDTAKFNISGEEKKVRFLAVDTPETKHPTKGEEPFGKEASNYTCNRLKKAKKIELEYDGNKEDKYGRTLAFIFVDDKLLQKDLVKNGYAKVAYLYKKYEYTDILKGAEENAKKNKKRIWNEEEVSKKLQTNSGKIIEKNNGKVKKSTKKGLNDDFFDEILDKIERKLVKWVESMI